MIKVTLKDGSVKELESACSVFDVAKEISPRLAKAACVAKIDGEIKDLRTVIDSDCTLRKRSVTLHLTFWHRLSKDFTLR